MAKFRTIKNSFLGGQISPTAVGRTDLPQYAHSCEILQNVIPETAGGAYRRPGSVNVDSLPITTNYAPRLIPFVVSRTETYCVVLGKTVGGANRVDVYQPISNLPGNAPSGTAKGNLLATNVGVHPYVYMTSINTQPAPYDDEVFQVQYAQSVDTMWFVHPNHKPQVLSRNASGPSSFEWHDFDAGTFANPFSLMQTVQSYPYRNQNATATTLVPGTGYNTVGASITLTASAALFNTGHGPSTVGGGDGAIFAIYDGASTIGFARVTAYTSPTVVQATVLVAFGGTVAKTTWWESAWSNYRGWPRSVCIFQQRLVMAGNLSQPDSLWASQTAGYFKFSALGDLAPPELQPGDSYTVDVSGVSVTKTAALVRYVDDSSEGDGMTNGCRGGQPFRITLAQTQVDQIQWMSPDKELLIGTLSQEWLSSPINGAWDVGNSNAVIQSRYGTDWTPAVRIGYELMMPMYDGREVRAYQYNYIDASFFAEPVQMFFDNYPKPEMGGNSSSLPSYNPGRRKFRQMQWDPTRQTLWCMDTAGNFFGMTRERKLQVTMWHTHQFGGYNPAQGWQLVSGVANIDPAYTNPDGSVVSFTVLPNPLLGINDIWVVVKRTVNTVVNWQVARIIGKFTPRESAYSIIYPGGSGPNGTLSEPYPLDNSVLATNTVNNGDGTTTITVPAGFEGYTLTGVAYNSAYGIFKINALTAVTSGSFTVSTASIPTVPVGATQQIVWGLPFTSIIQTARIDSGSVIGTAQGAIKRIAYAFIRFYKTLYCKVGSPPGGESESALETVAFVPATNPGYSPELYTGDKRVQVPSTYDRNGYLYIIQDQPFPFYIVSIMAVGEEFD